MTLSAENFPFVYAALCTFFLVVLLLYETVIVAFEIEYGQWVEEQHRRNEELRHAFQTQAPEVQLNVVVQSVLNHYSNLFRMKADAAKADVLYLLSGVWKASVERIFLWIGGSRPSQLLNVHSHTKSHFYNCFHFRFFYTDCQE